MDSIGATRTVRLVALALLIILLVVAGRPYVERLMFAATTPRQVSARGELSEAERATIDLFRRTSPSVVQVVSRANAGDMRELQSGSRAAQSGTGFVWDGAGHIVTNNHVVEGAGSVGVRFGSGQVTQAQITGTAPNYDLAVIRVANSGHLPRPIAIGTSADLKVGQFAYAIGNPFGLDQSLTTGVISALKRRLPTSAGREIANVIQTDVAINPGNSGGPLLDSAGRVVGVTTAIISPSGSNAGIGFAIPIDVVNRIVPELIRNGRVPTPGIGINAASEVATTRLGVQGIIVVRTIPGSPAARAGVRGVDPTTGKIGDVIVGVNGIPVRRLTDFTDALEQAGVGHEAQLEVERNGERRKVGVKVADISPP